MLATLSREGNVPSPAKAVIDTCNTAIIAGKRIYTGLCSTDPSQPPTPTSIHNMATTLDKHLDEEKDIGKLCPR